MTFKRAKEFVINGFARNRGAGDRIYRVLDVVYDAGQSWEKGDTPKILTLEFYGYTNGGSFRFASKKNVKTHIRKDANRKFEGDTGTISWYEPVFEDQSLTEAKPGYNPSTAKPAAAYHPYGY